MPDAVRNSLPGCGRSPDRRPRRETPPGVSPGDGPRGPRRRPDRDLHRWRNRRQADSVRPARVPVLDRRGIHGSSQKAQTRRPARHRRTDGRAAITVAQVLQRRPGHSRQAGWRSGAIPGPAVCRVLAARLRTAGGPDRAVAASGPQDVAPRASLLAGVSSLREAAGSAKIRLRTTTAVDIGLRFVTAWRNTVPAGATRESAGRAPPGPVAGRLAGVRPVHFSRSQLPGSRSGGATARPLRFAPLKSGAPCQPGARPADRQPGAARGGAGFRLQPQACQKGCCP